MEDLALKMKLAALWIIAELITFHPLYFVEPGVIEGIIAGEVEGAKITPELLLIFGIMYLGPLIMIFLSLTLKDSINRWVNIIAGIIYTILSIIDLGEHLANPSAYGILMRIGMIIAPALVVWYAWKWSKQED